MKAYELLCGHWTFMLNDYVARCDLEQGHKGLHKYWHNPAKGESFCWSERVERHEPRQKRA